MAAKVRSRISSSTSKVNAQPVDNAHSLSSRVAGLAPQTSVKITIQRNGEKKTLPVTLGKRPDEQTAENGTQGESDQKWGLAVQELNPALAERLGYDSDTRGLVVAQVEPMSPAAEASLQPGDLIREVNRTPVATIAEFKDAVREGDSKDQLLLLVKRGQSAFFSVLEAG